MAALSGKQVAAGALGVGAILGLCSCSSNTSATDPTISGGPTTQVEQTMSPSPSADSGFVLRTATEDDWPALADGYVFSDTPQSEAEQFIADNYPDLWDQGIRALSPKMVAGYNFGDPAQPGATVQYINGERYEGTNTEPLGFRGQIDDPESLPSDTVANVIATYTTNRDTWPAGNSGQGGYMIDINERDPKGTALEVYLFDENDSTKKLGTMYFGGWEEAWAYARSNGFSVPGMDRELYPGEVSSVTALRVDGPTKTSIWVFDPSVGNWVLAVDHSY